MEPMSRHPIAGPRLQNARLAWPDEWQLPHGGPLVAARTPRPVLPGAVVLPHGGNPCEGAIGVGSALDGRVNEQIYYRLLLSGTAFPRARDGPFICSVGACQLTNEGRPGALPLLYPPHCTEHTLMGILTPCGDVDLPSLGVRTPWGAEVSTTSCPSASTTRAPRHPSRRCCGAAPVRPKD